jgi:hypothetical protein
MGDREPRRRKKNRRDAQKKEDVRPEDHFFIPPKSEPRDSDQDAEEEPVIHGSHQPSNVAKIVFVILFSGLVVSLSVVFISLRDVKESSVDMFDVGHGDHGEALHDEHIEDALHDDHDEHAEHDDHDEHEVRLEDFIPSLSSILSLNNEQVNEVEEPPEPEDVTEATDVKEEVVTFEPEVLTDQGILEEYVEDSSERVEEPVEPTVYPDTTTYIPYSEEESPFASDYSETEDFSTPSSDDVYDDLPPAMDDQDIYSMYERADITNEADFEIREQLDEFEDVVSNGPNDLDNDNDEDDDDDDDEDDDNNNQEDDDDDEEEGVEEEFDFWQF